MKDGTSTYRISCNICITVFNGDNYSYNFFKTGKKEINPNEALVYKNQWTGKAKVKMAGMTILTPGINKEITRVSLKDEPHDPAETKINLSDGTEIGVDYVITKQKLLTR